MPVISIVEQTRLFLLSCGTGFLLGILYEVFRLLRMMFSAKKGSIFFFDIGYCLLATFVSFVFILTANRGAVRWYIIFGIAAGWVIYYFALGGVAVRFSKFITRCIKNTMKFSGRMIIAPFKVIWRFFHNISDKLVKTAKKK